ncbi:multicopper oxidase family protein [Halobacillus mangrovi]|uniref:multicopper oxidase family protein n=1 Tax=Halobacillus mangrovi TaxID=402384 RepID=UPI003D9866FF
MKILLTALVSAGILVLAACGQQEIKVDKNVEENKNGSGNTQSAEIKEFDITAKEVKWELSKEHQFTAYTYGGMVPGEEIRVQEGKTVKVNFTNNLNAPATIHWHGVPVPNDQDGIPGVTQDAVLPGETYTYQFTAEDPGTYWYHTHQNGTEMIDKGLYGTFIVEPEEKTPIDKDYTLVLDEWESSKLNREVSSHPGDAMDHGAHSSDQAQGMMGHDMSSYDIFTINGKTYESSSPLKVKKGDKVKLRFVNAGYIVHSMHIPVEYKVTHVDGQEINAPKVEDGSTLEIAPGERYDIEFSADGEKSFTIDNHGSGKAAEDMKIDVVYDDGKTETTSHPEELKEVDLTNLGEYREGPFSLEDSFDVEYEMDLGTAMSDQGMKMVWTINNEVYPHTKPFEVKKGEKVKVRLVNNSMDDSVHPMHLHGHFFQVLSKNGKPLEGSPIIKDTLNVKPGETYQVAFLADNPGNWLFHCHDLHHASNGMVTTLEYEGFEPSYTDTGKVENQPE